MRDLRTPKGTVDLRPAEALLLESVTEKIRAVYRRHRAVPISTPIFELRSTLASKYGEESKLIFNLEDQGGDICSLRYDLTVPFARFLAMSRTTRIRRYQIGPVFRRDSPSFQTGRLREFIQADMDICGDATPMLNDAEVIATAHEILASLLPSGSYAIRINDRRIIAFLLGAACRLPEERHATICSTIDKADKLAAGELETELASKGVDPGQIATIRKYMGLRGRSNAEVLRFLEGENTRIHDGVDAHPAHRQFAATVEEVRLLLDHLAILKAADSVAIDLSLARGLDYYTGMIFEAVVPDSPVGSVAGGGRYDGLYRTFSSISVPCVGFSVGVTRLLSALGALGPGPATPPHGILVGSAHGLLTSERLALLQLLWSNGFPAETFGGRRVSFKGQIEYARKHGIRLVVATGENEQSRGVLLAIDVQTNGRQEVPRDEIVSFLRGCGVDFHGGPDAPPPLR